MTSRSAQAKSADPQQSQDLSESAVTPAVPASADVVWDYCLSCSFPGAQLPTELLQLALLNAVNGTAFARY